MGKGGTAENYPSEERDTNDDRAQKGDEWVPESWRDRWNRADEGEEESEE